jgi:hypothetical protein
MAACPGKSNFAEKSEDAIVDAFTIIRKMAKQKFRPAMPGGFSGAKAYIRYVEVLEKRRNAVGRTFCDAIMHRSAPETGCLPADKES